MTFALLWWLATVDAGFSGYRDAAGRNPRIFKGPYYRRAILRGVLAGQVASFLVAATVGAQFVFVYDPAALRAALEGAATTLTWVYAPFSLAVLAAFLPYAVPRVEVRTLTSVSIFGPFTLIRPWVVLAGGVLAAWRAEPLAWPAIAVAVTAIFFLERSLGLAWRRGWHRDAGQAVGHRSG